MKRSQLWEGHTTECSNPGGPEGRSPGAVVPSAGAWGVSLTPEEGVPMAVTRDQSKVGRPVPLRTGRNRG